MNNVCAKNYIFYLRLRTKLLHVEWRQNEERRFYIRKAPAEFYFLEQKPLFVLLTV